ncbi:MAG: hypothetical protein AAFR76_01360 [Planctomycetota bacterium]
MRLNSTNRTAFLAMADQLHFEPGLYIRGDGVNVEGLALWYYTTYCDDSAGSDDIPHWLRDCADLVAGCSVEDIAQAAAKTHPHLRIRHNGRALVLFTRRPSCPNA